MKYSDMTLEKCEFSYRMGIGRICDADTKTFINELECFHCGEYFISKGFPLYCLECVKKYKSLYGGNKND